MGRSDLWHRLEAGYYDDTKFRQFIDDLETEFGTEALPIEIRQALLLRVAPPRSKTFDALAEIYQITASLALKGFEAGRNTPTHVQASLFYGVIIPNVKYEAVRSLGHSDNLQEYVEGNGLTLVPMGEKLIGVSRDGFIFKQAKGRVEEVFPPLPSISAEMVVEMQRILFSLELATQVPRWVLHSYGSHE